MKLPACQLSGRGFLITMPLIALALIMLPRIANAQIDQYKFIVHETAKCSALFTIMSAVHVPPENIGKLSRLDLADKEGLLKNQDTYKQGSDKYLRYANFMGDVYGYIRSEYMPTKKADLFELKEKHFSNYEEMMKTDESWYARVVLDQMTCQHYLNNFFANLGKDSSDLVGVAVASVYLTKDEELDIQNIGGYQYLSLIAFSHWEAIGFPTRKKLLDQMRQ